MVFLNFIYLFVGSFEDTEQGGEGYRVVCADGGREFFGAGSNNAGVFEKNY